MANGIYACDAFIVGMKEKKKCLMESCWHKNRKNGLNNINGHLSSFHSFFLFFFCSFFHFNLFLFLFLFYLLGMNELPVFSIYSSTDRACPVHWDAPMLQWEQIQEDCLVVQELEVDVPMQQMHFHLHDVIHQWIQPIHEVLHFREIALVKLIFRLQ